MSYRGEPNVECADCGEMFHAAPSQIDSLRRCHKCRVGRQNEKPDRDYERRLICPICGEMKSSDMSDMCVRCSRIRLKNLREELRKK